MIWIPVGPRRVINKENSLNERETVDAESAGRGQELPEKTLPYNELQDSDLYLAVESFRCDGCVFPIPQIPKPWLSSSNWAGFQLTPVSHFMLFCAQLVFRTMLVLHMSPSCVYL